MDASTGANLGLCSGQAMKLSCGTPFRKSSMAPS